MQIIPLLDTLSAKQLATSMKSGEVAPLTVSLSATIDMALLIRPLRELTRAFPSVELTFLRGGPIEVAGHLRKGEADMAIAGPLEEKWDRLDAWVLFSEEFDLVVNEDHRLAGSNAVALAQLRGERFLSRPYCEMAGLLVTLLRSHGLEHEAKHRMVSEQDLTPLLQANLGVGILPRSFQPGFHLTRLPVNDLDLERTVSLYAVAGRSRSCAASTFMLRAADWPEELNTFPSKASAKAPAAG